MNPRKVILDCFNAAIRAVDGEAVTYNFLSQHPPANRVAVVAVGKAAVSMWQGAKRALGDNIEASLLITKQGHLPAELAQAGFMEAEHPYPGHGSLTAGRALLQFLEEIPVDVQLVFLVSGGTSALVEVLPDGVTLNDLQRVNKWLLGSGLDIRQVNSVRKQLSMIKAGRLARHLGNRQVLNLLISDVPQNILSAVGSGLLLADEKTRALPQDLPEWLRILLHKASPAPAGNDSCFSRIQTVLLADNHMALQAAAEIAEHQGQAVKLCHEFLQGDALETGRRLAQQLKQWPGGIYLWGGETTVQLPPEPGQGGRNQSLALAAAQALEGEHSIWLLSAGTDGSDGPTSDAGALVDGGTIQRGEEEGLSATECLLRADAGRFLAASGDLINTGPTGTNVMDIIIGMKST